MTVQANLSPEPIESTIPPANAGAGRLRRLRLAVGYAAIAGTIPYLTLKLAWLSGSTVGITDMEFAKDDTIYVLNLFTAGMDLVAILLALVLTHSFGRRFPGWLLLVPMWVGTGFLVPIAAAIPAVSIAGLTSSAGASTERPPDVLESWVRPMVYGGFAWQGVMLTAAFVMYALVRWPSIFTGTSWHRPSDAVAAVLRPLAWGSAAMAGLAGMAHLAWAAGSNFGFSPEVVAGRTVQGNVVDAVMGLAALAGGVGVLAMMRRDRPRGPAWWPVAAAWIGAGAMFSWGLWHVTNVLSGTVFVAATGQMAIPQLHSLLKLIAGLLIGVASLVVLGGRSDTARQPRADDYSGQGRQLR